MKRSVVGTIVLSLALGGGFHSAWAVGPLGGSDTPVETAVSNGAPQGVPEVMQAQAQAIAQNGQPAENPPMQVTMHYPDGRVVSVPLPPGVDPAKVDVRELKNGGWVADLGDGRRITFRQDGTVTYNFGTVQSVEVVGDRVKITWTNGNVTDLQVGEARRKFSIKVSGNDGHHSVHVRVDGVHYEIGKGGAKITITKTLLDGTRIITTSDGKQRVIPGFLGRLLGYHRQ